MQSPKQYTIGQSAKLIGVSKSTIRSWIKNGKLQYSLDEQGTHSLTREAIEAVKTYYSALKQRSDSLIQKNGNQQKKAVSIKQPLYPLSLEKAAAFLHISKNTLLRWDQKGVIMSTRTPGGARRYYPHDLVTLLKTHSPYQRLPKQPPQPSASLYHVPRFMTEVVHESKPAINAPVHIEQTGAPLHPKVKAVISSLFAPVSPQSSAPSIPSPARGASPQISAPVLSAIPATTPFSQESAPSLTQPNAPFPLVSGSPAHTVFASRLPHLRYAIRTLPSILASPVVALGCALTLLLLGSSLIFIQLYPHISPLVYQKWYTPPPPMEVLGQQIERIPVPTPYFAVDDQTVADQLENQEPLEEIIDVADDTPDQPSLSDLFPFQSIIEAIGAVAMSITDQQSKTKSYEFSFTSLFGAFASAVIDTLRTTVLTATAITTQSLAIDGTNISDYIVTTMNNALRNGKLSFAITEGSIEHIKTHTISPIGSEGIDLLLTNNNDSNLSSNDIISPIPAVRIKNTDGTVVTSFSDVGDMTTVGDISADDASFSGELYTSSLAIASQAQESLDDIVLDVDGSATISGTLYATHMKTSFGDLNETIGDMESSISSLSGVIASLALQGETSSTIKGIASSENLRDDNPSSDFSLLTSDFSLPSSNLSATASALLASIFDTPPITPVDIDLSGKTLTINSAQLFGTITALGGATLGDTMIAGPLLVDATMKLDIDGIQAIGTPLMLQKSKLYGVDIMNGSMVIDQQGNVTLSDHLLVQGGVHTAVLSPLSEDISIDLSHTTIMATDSGNQKPSSFGKLLIKGENGQTVASFDSQGGASVSGTLTARDMVTQKLTVVRSDDKEESTVSTASVGVSMLPRGKVSIVIPSSQVTRDSLIFVTPTTPTEKTLSVTETDEGMFTVSVPTPSLTDITFNWWVIN